MPLFAFCVPPWSSWRRLDLASPGSHEVEVFHCVGAPARRLAFAAFDEVLTNGGHHPLLAHLQEGARPVGRWVVKPMFSVSAANRRPGLSLIAEALGAEACACLGLSTPEIAWLRFPQDSAELAHVVSPARWRDELQEVSALNLGELAFCCRFLRDQMLLEPELLPPARQAPALVSQAARIVALDLFLAHYDRRHSNPNLLFDGQQVTAIDHGDAFAGLERAGETGEGLAQKTVLPRAMRDHVLLGWLSSSPETIDWEALRGAFGAMTEATIQGWLTALPAELGEARLNNGHPVLPRLETFLRHRLARMPTLLTNLRELVENTP